MKRNLIPIITILAISIIYWLGISTVPFHPDESTQLYMASDFRAIFMRPGSIAWLSDREPDLKMHYREIDPPLSRYLIGLGLFIGGQQPLDQDWDWSKIWQENQQAGALPSANQLLAARLAVAVLFPVSLACAYWTGKKLRSPRLGWLWMGLIAVNALVLIHTRRAMAESGLLFGVSFSLLGLVSWRHKPFWLALPAALAFNAKYTALPLAIIGIAAILWDDRAQIYSWRRKLAHVSAYIGIFLGITFLLNPFLWKSPISALKDAISIRQELTYRQSQEIGAKNSVQVLNSVGQRGVAILSQVFFAPPASADVGNYNDDLQSSVQHYDANPLHVFMRGWVAGAVILFLTLVGVILFIIWLIRTRPKSRAGILVMATFFVQLALIFAGILFPFQRYYIPLIPFTTLFLAWCLLYPFELADRKKMNIPK